MKSKKLLSILLSICLAVSAFGLYAYADEPTTELDVTTTTAEVQATLTPEEAQALLEAQKLELQKKLKESEKKLAQFEESAKTTAEYIEALDEKIGYLNEELNILDSEMKTAQGKVDKLDKQISTLEKELKEVRDNYKKATGELTDLESKYESTFNAYCLRLRAMYISGSDSILVALITSHDLSQLFSRYEMIKAVAKSDTTLLNEVNTRMAEVTEQKAVIEDAKAKLEEDATKLGSKRAELKKERDKVENAQEKIAQKKIVIAQDRAQSDELYAKYAQETQMYSEFKYEDEQLIEQVDNEINDLLNGLISPDEVTTAVAGDTEHKTNSVITNTSALYSNSNAVLNMTYPAPGHYGVSQTYGHYRNGKAHTGIDYPYPVGSKVVAAQKGIVVKVRRLNYSYGYYIMIYHGTDAKGRKVVTLYAHNSAILVNVGQTVEKGQQIAKGGSTGNSTGPHCHFELILDGAKVNPKNYLSK